MKQISLGNAERETIREIVYAYNQVLFIFMGGKYATVNVLDMAALYSYKPVLKIKDFNIKDMLRLGFIDQGQLDAAERQKKTGEEAAEYKEYKRLRDKFEDKFVCGECDCVYPGTAKSCPHCDGSIAHGAAIKYDLEA